MTRSRKVPREKWGIEDLLKKYPGLSRRPQRDGSLVIEGNVEFRSRDGTIADSFSVSIHVPANFPGKPPSVKELKGRIPRTFHTNPDGTLCLSSPTQQLISLRQNPSLLGYVDDHLIQFLYSFSFHQKYGKMPHGELAHGYQGLVQDYQDILNAESEEVCLGMIYLLGMKKRIANKQPCPCGSGRWLGKCHNRVLNRLRGIKPRAEFREEYRRLKQNR
jgi:hypothetical protein